MRNKPVGAGKTPPPPPLKLSQGFGERAIFNYIVSRVEVSTPELVSRSGMPASTIAGILNRLAARGLVVPSRTETGQRGRPSIVYQLRIPRPIFVCQLDATQVSAAILARDLRVGKIESKSVSRIKSLAAATSEIRGVLQKLRSSSGHGSEQPRELALVVNAVLAAQPEVKSSVLPWVGQKMEEVLSQQLDLVVRIPPLAGMIAELQTLTNPVPHSFVRFHVGDGVSAHFVIEGQAFAGHASMAGELGHVIVDASGPLCGCGRRGCLEAYCGGPAIHKQFLRDLSSGVMTSIDAEEIAESSPRVSITKLYEAWRAGDTYARDFMRRVLDRLAWAVGILMNLLDPELILSCGYVLEDRPEWVDEIRQRAERWALGSRRPIPLQSGRANIEDELRAVGTMYFYQFNDNGKS